jgi:Outer membrane protein beta-barrel domain
MRKRVALLVVFGLSLMAPALLAAQDYDHGEVGVFADYFQLSRTDPKINFVGIGGRAGFNVSPHVALEGEMSYDFKRNFTSAFSNGITTQFVDTDLRPLSALFGPKFQAGTSGPFRAFVTGKLGFVNFSTSNQSAGAGFKSSLGAVTSGDTRFAIYPGAGVEAFWGPFGLRLDVGDEIYFDNGAQNNVKVEFGPHLRF